MPEQQFDNTDPEKKQKPDTRKYQKQVLFF